MPPRGGNAKKESGRAKKAENEAKKKESAIADKVCATGLLGRSYKRCKDTNIYRNIRRHPSGTRVLKRIRMPTRKPSARSSWPVRLKPPVSLQKRKPSHHLRKLLLTRVVIKRRAPSPQALVPSPMEAFRTKMARKRPLGNPRKSRAFPPLVSTMPWTCWKW